MKADDERFIIEISDRIQYTIIYYFCLLCVLLCVYNDRNLAAVFFYFIGLYVFFKSIIKIRGTNK